MSHTGTTEQHLAALLDAVADPDYDPEDDWSGDGPKCGASGPGGECCRNAGHHDGAWPVDSHVSFDSDHYAGWPVGWKPLEDKVRAVIDPGFAQRIAGSEEYRKGAADALALVRAILSH